MEGQETRSQEELGEAPNSSGFRLYLGIGLAIVIAFVVVVAWMGMSGEWRAWRAVAKLDGTRITRADLDQHVMSLVKQGRLRPEAINDPARRKDVERFALNDLIARRLLLAEAERLNIRVEPGEEDVAFGKAHGAQPGEARLAEAAKKVGEDEKQLREEVRRQLLMSRLAGKLTEGITVLDEEVASYYEAHRQVFIAPGMARLRLLIVESREEAERLREQALQGADFAALVGKQSKGGGKESGGDIGWLDPRMLPPKVAEAVAAIPDTGITSVIEAKEGYYVVRVEGRRGPRQLPLAEVREQIKQTLTAERKRAKLVQWLDERRRTARLEVYL